MSQKSWSAAVEDAVRRYVARTGTSVFDRSALVDVELPTIVAETGSQGSTPQQTLSRELQHLRDVGVLEFVGRGSYRLRDSNLSSFGQGTSKGVLVVGSHSVYKDEPENFYRFGPRWLPAMSKLLGQWVLYQEPRRAGKRGYFACAKIDRIVPDPQDASFHLALISSGSFLEFGQDVPFQRNGQAVERGLLYPGGRMNNGRAVQSVRSINDEDFNRILGFGLISPDELLPREDDVSTHVVREVQAPWDGPIDRATMLVQRSVRDRQFRKRVLDAYDCRCALTGMKLINGGGRAETQAAHIKSVEAGGPDIVTNGLALSGTVHWMFDRGLLSLTDSGEILLSRKINDVASVGKLLYADRRASLPLMSHMRPDPQYLDWHRTHCFHA